MRGHHSAGLKRLVLAAGVTLLFVAAAWAKPAECFTTDEGNYGCNFEGKDRAGSFEISAPGKPTYILNVDRPGLAYGFVNLGGRNVSLPGAFERADDDPACWSNNATGFRLCAW